MSVLIWIQTVDTLKGFLKDFLRIKGQVNLENKSLDDNKSMKNYPAYKDIKRLPGNSVRDD